MSFLITCARPGHLAGRGAVAIVLSEISGFPSATIPINLSIFHDGYRRQFPSHFIHFVFPLEYRWSLIHAANILADPLFQFLFR